MSTPGSALGPRAKSTFGLPHLVNETAFFRQLLDLSRFKVLVNVRETKNAEPTTQIATQCCQLKDKGPKETIA